MKRFISFEGGEGSGKSTQTKLLYDSIRKISKNVFVTREPGGTVQSEVIRDLLVQKQNFEWDPLTELLLINAARHEHLLNVIVPKLQKNNVVICDRYIDSTYAYQVIAQNVKKEFFEILNRNIIKDVMPEITFIIDLEPEIGLKRTLLRKNREKKYETFDLDFHKKVRDAFIHLSKTKNRIQLIDGKLSINEIHKKIVDYTNNMNILSKKIPYST